ncbi:MAG: TRAP transporter small permease [Actinomycetaceae bacterium]|nr:TRAP transporter small permease [Actinomycetaceae bacterium]
MRKAKKAVNYALSRIAALLLVVMTLLVLYQVFSRYVLNAPADWTEELVRYFLIWTGFIGAAYAFGSRQHMALIFVRERLPEKQKRVLMVVTDILILLFAIFIIIIAGTQLAFSARMELSPLLGISRGLVYAVAPISGVFIVLVQIINIWEDVTGKVLVKKEEVEG